jgi:hypothetical protein
MKDQGATTCSARAGHGFCASLPARNDPGQPALLRAACAPGSALRIIRPGDPRATLLLPEADLPGMPIGHGAAVAAVGLQIVIHTCEVEAEAAILRRLGAAEGAAGAQVIAGRWALSMIACCAPLGDVCGTGPGAPDLRDRQGNKGGNGDAGVHGGRVGGHSLQRVHGS